MPVCHLEMVHYSGLRMLVLGEHDDSMNADWDDPEHVVMADFQAVIEEAAGRMDWESLEGIGLEPCYCSDGVL